jgi:hypothetical protein
LVGSEYHLRANDWHDWNAKMRLVTSVSLEREVKEDGKLLAQLNNQSFSDYINDLLKREAEVERYRVEEARRILCPVSQRTLVRLP